jgi:hypothetical protein
MEIFEVKIDRNDRFNTPGLSPILFTLSPQIVPPISSVAIHVLHLRCEKFSKRYQPRRGYIKIATDFIDGTIFI